jgi:hypothetical protein
MRRFARVVASHLTPATHDIVYGIGLGFDPAPREYQETFIDSDVAAFIADTEALYLDWCVVHHWLEAHENQRFTEAYNHGRAQRASRRRSERRERQLT